MSGATRDQTGFSEFLDTLLQAEADCRDGRKMGACIKAARFALKPAIDLDTPR